MSAKTEPNHGAFPEDAFVNQNNDVAVASHYFGEASGLTKREYFAAMAMQGFCANPQRHGIGNVARAACAVEEADALIASLNNEPKGAKP